MKSEPKRLALKLGALCSLVTTYTASGAALVVFDQADFLSLVQPGYYAEGFQSFEPNDFLSSPQEFSGNGFEYSLSSPAGFGVAEYPPLSGETFLTPGDYSSPITATISSGNATAIGGNFFRVNDFATPIASTFTLTLSDGTVEEVTTTVGNEQAFVGFISTVPITSLVLSETPDVALQAIAVDNFIVGAAVPEPWQGATAVAIAALGFGLARRWLRARAG